MRCQEHCLAPTEQSEGGASGIMMADGILLFTTAECLIWVRCTQEAHLDALSSSKIPPWDIGSSFEGLLFTGFIALLRAYFYLLQPISLPNCRCT